MFELLEVLEAKSRRYMRHYFNLPNTPTLCLGESLWETPDVVCQLAVG
jgi:hypothetical protein